jgi:predicted ATP-dependent serine protease
MRAQQCVKCALRLDDPPIRCPSCGALATFVPVVHRATTRVLPGGAWDGEMPVGGAGGLGVPGFDPAALGFGGGEPVGFDPAAQAGPDVTTRVRGAKKPTLVVRDMDDVPATEFVRLPSGHPVLDQMTDGGPCIGTSSGLTAFPGVGKSTLVLEAAYHYRAAGRRVTILALEEPSGDVIARAIRCGLPERFPPGKRRGGKSHGWVQIISPQDGAEGESRAARESRMAFGFDIVLLLDQINPATEVLILDSVSRCHNPELGDKQGVPRQLKYAGHAFYERCHATGRYAGQKPLVGFAILQSTKEGDSAVPQAFTHTVDATYIGEHVTRDGSEVIATPDQKKPSGYVGFRSHGKNRNGSILSVAYAKMTARGLVSCSEDDVQISLAHEEKHEEARRAVKQKREPLGLAG